MIQQKVYCSISNTTTTNGDMCRFNHWTKRDWPVRDRLNVWEENVIAEQLVPRDKIVLPPLHKKLRLIKQFVEALDKDGDCFLFSLYFQEFSKSE